MQTCNERNDFASLCLGRPASKMDTILGLSPSYDTDPQYVLLEQHCYLDIEDDETSLPYIVTVEEQSRTVLSIRS